MFLLFFYDLTSFLYPGSFLLNADLDATFNNDQTHLNFRLLLVHLINRYRITRHITTWRYIRYNATHGLNKLGVMPWLVRGGLYVFF